VNGEGTLFGVPFSEWLDLRDEHRRYEATLKEIAASRYGKKAREALWPNDSEALRRVKSMVVAWRFR
jgi:hypothetical protein